MEASPLRDVAHAVGPGNLYPAAHGPLIEPKYSLKRALTES